MTIYDNINRIRDRIEAVCSRCSRNPYEVNVEAVSKTVGPEKIREAIRCGITIIGENRVQEAWSKRQLVPEKASWHMIGHLQTNKVKRALEFAHVIESVDSLHLAREINRRAAAQGKIANFFIEVNTSGETSKYGVDPEEAFDLFHEISALPNVKVNGLMTIGAFLQDPEQVRPCFRILRKLRDQINATETKLEHLSMGMTNDYEVAIEEGATIIRIGRAIFGERNT